MYEIILSKLRLCSSLNHINQLHGFLIHTEFYNHTIILSKLIEKCSIIGEFKYGHLIFKHNYQPNIYLYNTMINSLASNRFTAKESLVLFNDIRIVGITPDSYTFPFVLKAVSRVLDGCVGEQVHGQVVKCGFEANIHVGIGLVKMYSSCGCVENARHVFDEMPRRDSVALWNAMIAGYFSVGDMSSGRELFDGMRVRNVISWTSMIAGYVHVKRPNDAIEMFRRMMGDGVEVDEVALLAALSACADLGAFELGKWVHGLIDQRGLRKTVRLCNALVDMYLKSGNVRKALDAFEGMVNKSVVSWTTMIVGLAYNGLGREALEMFSRMERAGTIPNEVTFIGILSACSHVGLVELGQLYFKSMSLKYGITPKIQHYGCMIDLLGREGCLREAEDLVKLMPFKANAAIWGSLLAGARTRGDISLAEKALQHLSVLEPKNSGNLTLLSNTYAALGEWNEARLVRKTMRNSGVKKLRGESFIELNGSVHIFVSGTLPNLEAQEIHEALWDINQQCMMKRIMVAC